MKLFLHRLMIFFKLSFIIIPALALADIKNDFKKNPPLFYAAIAEASYEGGKRAAQSTLDKLLGTGEATVINFKDHTHAVIGSTHFILVMDKHGGYHVGIEGSNSFRNWIGNALAPIRGAVGEHDVSTYILEAMQRIVEGYKRNCHHIVSIVGHSRGGMFASQLKHKFKNKHEATIAMTFNGFKVKDKANKNQYHFSVHNEAASTICSPSGRYIPVTTGGGYWRIVSNHQMKYILSSFKNKDWDTIL